MFTGIIEELGEVTAWQPSGDSARVTVRAPLAASDARRVGRISFIHMAWAVPLGIAARA